MNTQTGFTLIESLVIISLISILTAMSVRAIPTIRAHQELVSDTENIRALLYDAKQRTLNQVRPENCLPGVPDDLARARCSDVGVALKNGELIIFADTAPSVQNYNYDTGDREIVRSKLATNVDTGSATSLVFAGVPPSAVLYKDGVALTGGSDFTRIMLTASNGSKRSIKIYSFGTMEIEL